MDDGFINVNDFNYKIVESNQNNSFINEKLVLLPLYKKIKDIPKPIFEIFPLSCNKVELYCNECKKRRIYTFATIGERYFKMNKASSLSRSPSHSYTSIFIENQYFYFVAKADCGHDLIIIFKVIDENTVMKVGQYPSIYDMNEEINNRKFLKELGEEYSSYYTKACSLNSFNSNIGAMTYLRRIFEKLLLDCFYENKEKITMSKDEFCKLKIEEKLKKLKTFLPEIIFANGYSKIYSKISDGIHNLSDDECEELFIPLRMAIEEILIEKIELKEKKNRQNLLGKTLQNL